MEDRTIKRISLVDQVSEGLAELIERDGLKPGDKLPPEAELAEAFGVNRFTVRMALQKLITLGRVETRVGDGSYVREFNVGSYFDQVADIGLANESGEDIANLRRAVELEAARLAMERATAEELAELREKAGAIAPNGRPEDWPGRDYAAQAEADVAFHEYLSVCSHNALFRKLYVLLRPQIKAQILNELVSRTDNALRERQFVDPEKNYHLDICDAIEAGDWPRCEELLLNMTEYTETR